MNESKEAYEMTPEERAATVREMMDNGTTEFMKLWACINFSPVKCARALFTYRPDGYVKATRSLGNYASNLHAYKTSGNNCYLHSLELCKSDFEGLISIVDSSDLLVFRAI